MHKTFAIPPGETILELMEIHHVNQNDFINRMNISSHDFDNLIHGITKIDSLLANKLQLVLGSPAQFWLNLQNIFDRDSKEG